MRLASKFWFLLRVNTKWKGAGVGGTAHSSRYVPSGLNDLYILALSTSTHLRDFPCVHLSSIWMNVRTLVRKCLYRSGTTAERAGKGRGGSSAHSPTSAPRGFKVSNTLTPSRETSRPDDAPDSPGSKKQKLTSTHLSSHPQSSTGLSSHVDFKCVTININRFSEEKWKYILSLQITKSVSVIILTEHHLSATFRPKEVIDSGWIIRAVAGVPKRRSKQPQHRGGVAILY